MTDVSEDITPRLAATASVSRFRWARTTLARLGGVTLAVLIVGAYFSVKTNGQLLVVDNLLGILRGLSTIAIIGFGLTVVIIVAEIDLSFGAVYGLSTNIVAVAWITHGVSVYLAIGLAFLAAIGVGLFNAFFTAVVKIPSFIATLGSSTLVFGLTLYIGQTQNISCQYPPTDHPVSHSEASFFTNLGNASL